MAEHVETEPQDNTNNVMYTETAELAEQRRRAEERKKKRATFLNSVDEFSQDFEFQSLIDEKKRTEVIENEKITINEKIKSSSHFYSSTKQLSIDNSNLLPLENENSQEILTSTFENVSGNQVESAIPPVLCKIHSITENLTQSTKTIDENINQPQPVEDYLSVPRRIGSKMDKKSKNASLKSEDLISFSSKQTICNDSDDEKAGVTNTPKVSHILTNDERRDPSFDKKIAWKALQQDLISRRKDFHGAVTYAFDGIFCWQMYGSAEAVDEMGKVYTEYLMRCQWGTSWENLQPWIAARRYREFDKLDTEFKKRFPNLMMTLPRLAEKDYFRFLEADVIAKRRRNIQDYMSVIVSSIPTLLRSSAMDEFLGISVRIAAIKSQLVRSFEGTSATSELFKPQTSSWLNSHDNSNQVYSTDNLHIVTPELADSYKTVNNCQPLDEDQLGELEEDSRLLSISLNGFSGKDIRHENDLKKRLVKCTNVWPSLRLACELKDGVDVSLIPRSLQAEEDLQHCLRNYRRLLASHAFV